jgi:capsular exopolysaccharide synthesis family protein
MTPTLPRGPTSANPTNPNGLPKFNLHMLLSALRCWWHIALPLGLVLGACAATSVFYLSKPVYTASAWLSIKERSPILLRNATLDDPRKFVANQIELIRSPLVLDPVIAIRDVRSAPELIEDEDPALYLRNHLKVEPKGGSDLFVIEFTSQDPAKAARIVNEVTKSYLALQQRHDSQVHERMVDVLLRQQDARQKEIDQIRRRLEDKTKLLTGQSAFPARRRESRLEQGNKFEELEKSLLVEQVNEVELKAKLQAEEELLKNESFDPPPELVAVHVNKHPKIGALQASLAADKEKLAVYDQRSPDPAKNPLYLQLKRRIQTDEAELNRLTKELEGEVAKGLAESAKAKREGEIFRLKADLFRISATIGFLRSELKTETKDQADANVDTLQLEIEWDNLHRATDLHAAISNRIDSMQLERQAPERVELLRDATVPVRPDEEVPYKNMLLAALAALALPFALAVGIEILFCRVGSRQQLETSGGIMVVGEITTLPRRIKSRRAQAEPHREVQLYEESINGLRTYLTLIDSARSQRVLAVTSSVSREGKTSLAAQLAVSVANSSGKPTLLIDGDMRSPDLHRIFDVDCGPGLADVLAGRCPVEEAIETSFSSRLHVLTAGHLTVNPHQLTGAGEFERLIEKLRGMYDHVIIDTPPILPASEALLMARAADAAILCVRRDYSRVDQVSEAHGRLVAAGVKVAGAVLNGVPSQAYAFRYGSYYYTKSRPSEPPAPQSDEPSIAASA